MAPHVYGYGVLRTHLPFWSWITEVHFVVWVLPTSCGWVMPWFVQL